MKKSLLVALVCTGLSLIAHAEGGTTVGSGGDALRELFNNAKGVAATKVEQLNTCAFEPSTPQDVRDWLIKNQTKLAMDIRLTQHAWVVDSQSTCGFTNHSAQSTIYLSYPTCATTAMTVNDALFVLIHESAHHLGVSNEHDADKIARAVLYSRHVPNCSTGQGVFDPNICSSAPMTTDDARQYFQPGDTHVRVGNYGIYAQITRCVALSGCEPAKPWEGFVAKISYRDAHGYYTTSPITAINLSLTAETSSPYFLQRLSINNRSHPILEQNFLADLSGSYGPQFEGKGYRDGSLTFGTNFPNVNKLGMVRVRRDCFWSKWTHTFDRNDGAQETVDVVMYGTH